MEMDRFSQSCRRHGGTPGCLYRMVPALCRPARRRDFQMARRRLTGGIAMATNVLIYDVRGEQYRALLGKRFPTVSFHIGHEIHEVEGVIGDIDVIFGLGHHIPPALLAKAKNLKWVQALT